MGQVSKAWVMFTDRSVFTWLRSVPRWALCAAGRLGTATDSATQGRALFVCEPPYFCSARAGWRRESAGTWDARRVNLRNTRQRLRMCLDMTGVGVGWGEVGFTQRVVFSLTLPLPPVPYITSVPFSLVFRFFSNTGCTYAAECTSHCEWKWTTISFDRKFTCILRKTVILFVFITLRVFSLL